MPCVNVGADAYIATVLGVICACTAFGQSLKPVVPCTMKKYFFLLKIFVRYEIFYKKKHLLFENVHLCLPLQVSLGNTCMLCKEQDELL